MGAALTLTLATIAFFAPNSVAAVALVVLLGAFGMVCNRVPVSLVVGQAGNSATFAVLLSTSSFNVGIEEGPGSAANRWQVPWGRKDPH